MGGGEGWRGWPQPHWQPHDQERDGSRWSSLLVTGLEAVRSRTPGVESAAVRIATDEDQPGSDPARFRTWASRPRGVADEVDEIADSAGSRMTLHVEVTGQGVGRCARHVKCDPFRRLQTLRFRFTRPLTRAHFKPAPPPRRQGGGERAPLLLPATDRREERHAVITIRRADERGNANHGWLDSHHTHFRQQHN